MLEVCNAVIGSVKCQREKFHIGPHRAIVCGKIAEWDILPWERYIPYRLSDKIIRLVKEGHLSVQNVFTDKILAHKTLFEEYDPDRIFMDVD